MPNRTIRISDWTKTPGARLIEQGPYSAELFKQEVLDAAFEDVLSDDSVLTIDLDGVAGYMPSFIEEVFGGLARKHTTSTVERHLDIICEDDEYHLKEAWEHVRDPKPEKRRNR
jgi:hypothetical protein